jgi:hypothetical protein
MLMANAHRYAIEYIEQAPVIVAAATRGQRHISGSECAFVQEQLSNMCESGAKLRDVMHTYGLPLPLRLLDARALTASRTTVIRRLALLNPSTLAQIIPASRKDQNAWLQALDLWCSSMARRDDPRCLFFEWAAIKYSGIRYGETPGVHHMVDFVLAHPNTFNPRWTLDRARAEEHKWHMELARNETVDDDEDLGSRPDTIIDYAPLPLLWKHDDLSFVALQTREALHAEGAAMLHCVASYWWSVASGWSRIYSVLKNGSRVATVELTTNDERYKWGKTRYRVRQTVGARNSRPTPEVVEAVGSFVGEINDRLGGSSASLTKDQEATLTASAVGGAQ